MIKIIYEDNHIIVVLKPHNMPVCPDSSCDLDLLSYLKSYLKDKYNKPGNVYLGLIHRLDRPVSGIMVFAKTSKAAGRLSEQVRTNGITKKYYCVCNNLSGGGCFRDKLFKDSKMNIVRVDDRGKDSILEYNVIGVKDGFSFVDVHLITGRPHQIRVQFSSRGYPLYGDQKYNKNSKVGQQIALFSYYLSFMHPITKETMEFKEDIPTRYPFNLFVNK